MESITVALVQHASPMGHKAANLERTVALARAAAAQGASLVAFPELGITGHAGHRAMVAEAEEVPNGPACRLLTELAIELGITISAGIAEDDLGIHYNTQFLVGPDGYIGKQRKIHLSRDEYFYFRAGTHMPVLAIPGARVGTVICYDSEFPEPARCLAVKGAEVILAPHAARAGAWRSEADRRKAVASRKQHWSVTLASHALFNGCFVLAANTAGRSADDYPGVEANHPGGCMAFDPYGGLIAESRCQDVEEETLIVPLDGSLVAERRSQACFMLQTRRPEVYGALVEPTL
jgi:predicted amidohydrolase